MVCTMNNFVTYIDPGNLVRGSGPSEEGAKVNFTPRTTILRQGSQRAASPSAARIYVDHLASAALPDRLELDPAALAHDEYPTPRVLRIRSVYPRVARLHHEVGTEVPRFGTPPPVKYGVEGVDRRL